MTHLIITSCTGEKVVESDRQLTREDFARGAAHVAEREKELKDSLRTAGEIYSGEQHVRLMRGVSAMRSTLDAGPSPIELHILSAGYGLIPEDRVVAPYEITFATMKSKELRDWADSLQVPEDFRKTVAKPYEFGLILLGDNYLTACALDSSVKFGGPTLLFCGTGMAKKLPTLANVRVVPVSNPEAKRFSCGLVGLKGELAARVLAGVKADSSVVTKILDSKFDVLGWLDGIAKSSSTTKPTRKKATSKASPDGKATLPPVSPKIDWVIQIPQSWRDKPHRKKLRYFIPEWDDLVDPEYDFLTDTHSGENCNWEHAVYAHQLYSEPNYDGLLMSRAIAEKSKAKSLRINELGVHRMLRVPRDFPVMGDCGAFDYIMEEKPPYSTADVLDYYTRLDFDLGVSVDHLIVTATEDQKKFRYDLTIHNAEDFLKEHRKAGLKWEPIGAVQGWDPDSYARAAAQYVKMGYRYIGLGGLVRSQTAEIMAILHKVKEKVPSDIDIHLFGLARLNAVKDMAALGVTSVDSASPLRRAWLGGKDNYWTPDNKHYRAIRIPEAGKSFRAKRMVSEGRAESHFVQSVESKLMKLLRSFDVGKEKVDHVLEALSEYDHLITPDRDSELDEYRRTLEAKPWKECPCDICKKDGIEVVIFRGNNRNRRRGFHNVYVFYRLMQGILNGTIKPPARTRGGHAYHPELELGV
jgi:queuine/archaeosine tRNA-ribosyltransferase